MDGRLRLRLGPGDVVRVHESSSPVMTMCREEPTADWLNALTRCLGWNDRPKPTQ
jgi:NAD kinase